MRRSALASGESGMIEGKHLQYGVAQGCLAGTAFRVELSELV